MKLPDLAILWKITARNWMGWPIERRHRLTGRVQHMRYNESSKWQDGAPPVEGGCHGR
ncbi:hypothetical protein [Xanthomonas albilineans]|uniref:hypothetical protein n=1 Tax=Xanthomonas albilineans TaxID=29447 RepID=UPI0012D3DFAF|nr:hypothetical protein [Xanthomonas albilineans]